MSNYSSLSAEDLNKKRDTHLTVRHQKEVMKGMQMLGQLNLHLSSLRGNVKSGYAALEGRDKNHALKSLGKVMALREAAHTELIEYHRYLGRLKR